MKKVLSIFFILFLVSCASNKGAKFEKLVEAKNNEAIIYFYRPSYFGAMVHYTVKDEDKKPIQKIYPYSYFYIKLTNLEKENFQLKQKQRKKFLLM